MKKNLEFGNLSMISTAQTIFLSQVLNIGKIYVFKNNCKCSISPIVKNILNEHYYTPQSGILNTFTQVRDKEREKKEKEEKRLLRDIFV